MKFGHELLALEQDCPEEYRQRFLKYKQLKKAIKRIRNAADGSSTPDSPEEQQFLALLNAEVAAVNRTFEQHAQQLVHSAAAKRQRSKGCRSCCLPKFCPRKASQQLKAEELARHARWCRRYATVNATGLRKIAKKHDKYARNSAGQQFLQACWDCRNRELGAFLHSPLIDELRALEALSEAHRATSPSQVVHAPAHSSTVMAPQRDGGSVSASATPVFSPALSQQLEGRGTRQAVEMMEIQPADESPSAKRADSVRSGDSGEGTSFRCAICLAPMWMPLGLSCGHIFCTECVFHAVGIRNWTRPLKDVLADILPTATCPKCRQRYVFREVLELKELGAVIRLRYPEVGERAAEVAADLKAAQEAKKKAAAKQRRNRLTELMEPFPRGA